jgi:uncharacterized protein YbaA (DUF1428 family)
MKAKASSLIDTNSDSANHAIKLNDSFSDYPVLIAVVYRINKLNNSAYSSSKASAVNKLIKFIDFTQSTYKSEDSTPNTLLVEYATHLSRDTEYSVSTINSIIGSIKSCLVERKDTSWLSSFPTEKYRHYLRVIAETIYLPEETSATPRFAMSQLAPEMHLDDALLINSLIYFCVAFLEIMMQQRNYFRQSHFTQAAINSFNLTPEIWDNNTFTWNAKSIPANFDGIFNAIIQSKNLALMERLLCSRRSFREKIQSAESVNTSEQIYSALRTSLYGYGGIRRYSNILAEDFYPTFDDFDYKFIFTATDAEEICLSWLLASDRIQQSGINELLIDDVEITPTNCTVMYTKKRSGEEVRDSTTHRKNSWQYKIYSYYKALRNETRLVKPGNRNQYFISKTNLFHHIQSLSSVACRPIQVACMSQSKLHEEILTKKPESKIFCDYFYTLLKRNGQVIKRRKRKAKQQESASNDLFSDQNHEIKLTLTPNTVAQSRAIIESEPADNIDNYTRYAASFVDAHTTAHSEHTKEVIYKGRSETLHRQNHRALFTNAVSELQENDARKVIALLQKTKIISLDNLKKELGWETGVVSHDYVQQFNSMVESAESHGYHCSPFGSLNHNNSNARIIVISPVTAALLESFIEACEIELDNVDGSERQLSLILQKTYATLLLERFDKNVVEKGREVNAKYNFPRPRI